MHVQYNVLYNRNYNNNIKDHNFKYDINLHLIYTDWLDTEQQKKNMILTKNAKYNKNIWEKIT